MKKAVYLLAAFLVCLVTVKAQVNLQQGLIAKYYFHGNASDESGNGYTGTPHSVILTTDRFENIISCYEFATGTSITIPDNDQFDLQNFFSISAWVCPYNISGFKDILTKWKSGGQFSYVLNLHDGHPMLLISPDGKEPIYPENSVTGSTLLSINKWYHIVAIYTGTELKMYVNSLPDGSFTYDKDPFLSTANLYIGGTDVSYNPFKGKIDDLRVYHRAINEQEILKLYNEGIYFQTVTVTDTLLINVNQTGFSPVTYRNTIKIFPNPAIDHLNIDFGNNYETLSGYSLKILNALSQVVYTTPINQQLTTLNLSTWTGKGVYFVQIIDNKGNIIDIKKIILQ